LPHALENSRNLATAHLLDGGIANNPKDSLARVCHWRSPLGSTLSAGLYPFVLNAQPFRMVDLAAFYAAIANEGIRPAPHTIESIAQNGNVLYRLQKPSGVRSATSIRRTSIGCRACGPATGVIVATGLN
jgi:membrane peptidoglycan carboxypeptidase